jgi:hypothetical protein
VEQKNEADEENVGIAWASKLRARKVLLMDEVEPLRQCLFFFLFSPLNESVLQKMRVLWYAAYSKRDGSTLHPHTSVATQK